MFISCKDESLGQGSFTRIYKGYKTDIRDGEKHVTEVFLKELDAVHRNCWEVGLKNPDLFECLIFVWIIQRSIILNLALFTLFLSCLFLLSVIL